MTRFAVWFSTLLAVVLMPLLVRTAPSPVLQPAHLQLSRSWANDLFIGWLIIASVLIVRLGFSLWHVWQLRGECREIDSAAHPELTETLARQASGREVKLLISGKVRIPTAVGFFRPAVVLPVWTLDQLSVEELNAVVLHELAHLRRWDDWTNLAQKILKAIFFFHPAVWFIESRLAIEREIACDDFVVEQTANAKSYAASLVSLAEKALQERVSLKRTLALAQSALGRMRQTSQRIVRILQPGRSYSKNSQSHRTWWAAAAGAAVLTVALVTTPYAPEMVSFKGQPELAASVASSVLTTISDVPTMQVRAIKASAKIGGPSERGGASFVGEGPIRLRSGQVRPTLSTAATMRPKLPAVVPARARLRGSNKPKLLLSKAKVDQQPAPMLLVFELTDHQLTDHESAGLDTLGSLRVWSLCVWRVTAGADGATHIEETIVMNRI